MEIKDIITLLGGVALFLFGMSLMGEGLKKVAGNKMELVLYRLSSTPVRGVFLGTGVTAIIQSSSATSAMVVGFVNSGMMKLSQALPVVEGALIGTSITGWILCLSSLQGGGWVTILSASTLAAIVAVVGIILRMFSKKQVRRHAGEIMLGFSVLMFGMQTMSGAVEPLKESAIFIELMTSFSHPLIGILVAAVFTAILQSASAAIGILQALSMTGAISFAVAWPMILGIGIGSAAPVLLSAIGAKSDGRRVALLFLLIELIAATVFAVLYYGADALFHFGLGSLVMNPVLIAAVNTGFRVLSIAMILPFNRALIALTERLIRTSEDEALANASLDRLDERFLAHPALAVEQSRLTTNDMLESSRQNLMEALSLLANYSDESFSAVEAREDRVDQYEDKIGSYLVRLNAMELSHQQSIEVSKILHTLSDFERISDHAMNLAETAREIHEKKIHFSEQGQHELNVLLQAIYEVLRLSFNGFSANDTSLAYRVEPLEEHIDEMCDEMKNHHVERLQTGVCSIDIGFVYNDLLTNLERIETEENSFDAHDYVIRVREQREHHFDTYYNEYCERFVI